MKEVKRYLQEYIESDLNRKTVFLTDPRQVGKTFLSKQVMKKFTDSIYLNYDDISDREVIKKRVAFKFNSDNTG